MNKRTARYLLLFGSVSLTATTTTISPSYSPYPLPSFPNCPYACAPYGQFHYPPFARRMITTPPTSLHQKALLFFRRSSSAVCSEKRDGCFIISEICMVMNSDRKMDARDLAIHFPSPALAGYLGPARPKTSTR